MSNEEIIQRLETLEARNRRVEADKAWETSTIRRVSIILVTYVVVALYLGFVVRINPWVNALVPVIGFTLSTLTLSLVKEAWLKIHGSK